MAARVERIRPFADLAIQAADDQHFVHGDHSIDEADILSVHGRKDKGFFERGESGNSI
jgi:hypothetical protein